MGRQNHLLAGTQGVARRQRLHLKHVNSSAAQVPRPQGCRQGFLIHQGPAADVDQDRSRLHAGQLGLTDEMPGLFGQLEMEADHVGAAQQLFQLHKSDAQLSGSLSRRLKGPGDDSHAEEAPQPGHLGSDVARPHHSQRLALQKEAVDTNPITRTNRGCLVRGPLGDRKHQAEGVLGNDGRGLARHVANDDFLSPGSLDIDGVDADPADGDHLEPGQFLQDICRPFNRVAGVDQHVGLPGPAYLLLA